MSTFLLSAATHMIHVFAVRYSQVTSTRILVRLYQCFVQLKDSLSRFSRSVRVRSYQYLIQLKDLSSRFLSLLDSGKKPSCISTLRSYEVLARGIVPKTVPKPK